MAILGRLKSWFGEAKTATTLASAATVRVPSEGSTFHVSGSTTITSLVAAQESYNRLVMFIGAASASVLFTNTTGTTTAGQMDLGGASVLLAEKDIAIFRVNHQGVWRLVSFRQNNASTTTVASATSPTIPDTGDIFYISGTTAVTSLTVTATDRDRRILLVGAAGAVVEFSNTNTPSSAGQMYLGGVNRTLREDQTLDLLVKATTRYITIVGTTTG